VKSHPDSGNETVLYAESRWAFFDQYGQPTAQPKPSQLGFPENAEILWGKSQIRTVIYAPWNGQRRSRDADRICIEKGSVLVIKCDQTVDPAAFTAGVGQYKAEGFGRVLVNPEFLSSNDEGRLDLILREAEADAPPPKSSSDSGPPLSGQDKQLLGWLSIQHSQRVRREEILTKVNAFVCGNGQVFRDISPSQWGQIRAEAARAKDVPGLDRALFADKTGLLMHGVSEEKWRKGGARKALHEELERNAACGPVYALRLAAAMQKTVQQKSTDRGNAE